jgi:hypothetical protein
LTVLSAAASVSSSMPSLAINQSADREDYKR